MAPRKRNKQSPSNAVGTVTALVAENASLKTRVAELETERQAITAALASHFGKTPKATKVVKTRRKITDPAILEKRREALAKARAARATKRATAAAETEATVGELLTETAPVTTPKPKRIRKPKAVVEQAESETVTLHDEPSEATAAE